MATASSSSDFLKTTAKGLLSPWMIVCYLAIGTLPYWTNAIVYVVLQSYFFAPNGLVPWFFVILVGSIAIWAFVANFIELARTAREIRSAKKGSDSGDPDAAKRYAELRGAPMPVRTMAIGFLAAYLVIPFGVTLAVGDQIMESPNLVRSEGRLRHETQQESLTNFLQRMEAKGIFNPWGD